MLVSIIICTRNRAEHLRETLASLRSVRIPEGMPTELIIVDNASADVTQAVVAECGLSNMAVRYLQEPNPGQCRARNAGVAAARGEIILFTDDDVRPAVDWVVGVCQPILAGQADAVIGGVNIPPHLDRPWMESMHHTWMASTAGLDVADPPALVGANMAFSREVLKKVPAFDTELGPGALGFCDETLFSLQLKQAGYRIASAYDMSVEHHFDPSRLTRASFLHRAVGQGKSEAYLNHHWMHSDIPKASLLFAKRTLRLWRLRMRHRSEYRADGVPVWEMITVRDIAFYKHFLVERRKPRHYEQFGLVKHSLYEVRASG